MPLQEINYSKDLVDLCFAFAFPISEYKLAICA